MKFIILCCLGISTVVATLQDLLDEWEQEIQEQKVHASQTIYNQIIEELIMNPTALETTVKSRLYRQYGQYILYGLDAYDSIDYPKALYFFKKSADLGNTKAMFYTSLLTYYKLDGSLAIQDNVNTPKLLKSYATHKHSSVSLTEQYFGALQNNQMSSLSIGYRHLRGIGVERNCSNAALFFLPVLEEYSHTPTKAKYVIENKRLGQLLYDSDFFMSFELNIHEHAQIFEGLRQVTFESVLEVKQLAFNFYYGLNGLRRNFTKAYELYYQIWQDVQDKESQVILGQMIVEGLVPNKNDYSLAYQLFHVDTKNQELLGKAYNGLGYIYFRGLGVQRDVIKAQEYFKKSADLKNVDGHFNLGSLMSLPSTLERERNKNKAIHHFEVASNEGHALAQYSLALMLLDGVDIFYSCELGGNLLLSAIQRGPWADGLLQANAQFQMGHYEMSFIRYLEASYLSYNLGTQNAAVVAELYGGLSMTSELFTDVGERIQSEILYQLLSDKSEDIFNYIYSDYLQLLDNPEQLKPLLVNDQQQYIGWLTFQLYQQCSKEKEGLCHMRLGDHYYYGKYKEQNYKLAFEYYKKALDGGGLIDAMRAHSYFNLGLMRAQGLGVEYNRDKARMLFEKSLTQYTLIPGIPATVLLDIIDYSIHTYVLIMQGGWEQFINDIDMIEFCKQTAESIESYVVEHSRILVGACLWLSLIVIYGMSLKYQNMNINM